jgi:hypothetical protein
MDEIWQRHKSFILQCVIGGLVFLIALVVLTNAYSGIEGAQTNNRSLVADLKKKVAAKEAPSKRSIDDQKRKAEDALQQIKNMGAQVASLATGEDYVRENVRWVLAVLGRPEQDAERFVQIYRNIPQSALTTLRSEAQQVLGRRAAQGGKQIDESFGLSGGLEDDEVPGGIHGLALVCEVISRALEHDGIAAVGDFRVNPRNQIDRDIAWLSGIEVRLSMTGAPEDVTAVIRSFNRLEGQPRRMLVLKEVESIVRRSADEDTVKAVVVLYGLQMKGDDL